jgi:hypothetical protein
MTSSFVVCSVTFFAFVCYDGLVTIEVSASFALMDDTTVAVFSSYSCTTRTRATAVAAAVATVAALAIIPSSLLLSKKVSPIPHYNQSSAVRVVVFNSWVTQFLT